MPPSPSVSRNPIRTSTSLAVAGLIQDVLGCRAREKAADDPHPQSVK